MLIMKNRAISSLLPLLFLVITLHVRLASSCAINEVPCLNRECILKGERCDGVVHCADRSDEGDICECGKGETFMCPGNSSCIYKWQLCDGFGDCENREDEMNCEETTNKLKCESNEWACEDQVMCIPLKNRCDGEPLCMDESDEKNCNGKCGGFLCHNEKCLSDPGSQCNGKDDCGDNSDEFHCDAGCYLSLDRFSCTDNSSCLPLSMVCDGKKNCVDGSDEGLKCSRTSCSTLKCPSNKCIQLPSGPQCHCGKGFKFEETTNTCVDVDECQIPGTCSQKCRNLQGSFQCECVDHFHLAGDKRTCVSNVNESSWVYFTTATGLYKWNVEKEVEIRIRDHLSDVVAVAAGEEYVYWTEIQEKSQRVCRQKHEGSEVETITLNGVGSAEGIALDWWTENIYYTDSVFNQIAVCESLGRYCMALITDGLEKPRGIALNPKTGHMFWTDWGAKPHIGTSYMDGTEPEVFIENDVHWPNGLTIDHYGSDRIFWVDAKTGTLESVGMDGKNRHILTKNDNWHVFNVEVLGERIFWTEKHEFTMNSLNKSTGRDVQFILRKEKLRSLYAYHPAVHKKLNDSVNPCHQRHCAHLCLLTKNGGSVCRCSEGRELTEGGMCLGENERVLIGYKNYLMELEYVALGVPRITFQKRIVSLDKVSIDRLSINPVNKDLFVANNNVKEILHIRPTYFRHIDPLIKDDLGEVSCLAFDHHANNLYWTDSEYNSLEVFSLFSRQRSTVHLFPFDSPPHAFVLALKIGKIFVAVDKNPVRLYSMSLNGANVLQIKKWRMSGYSATVAMTIDEDQSMIYVAVGTKIVEWNYVQNKESVHRSNLFNNINQLTMIPGIQRLFWTGGDDVIHWDSKHRKIDKSMRLDLVAGKFGGAPDNIPLAPYSSTKEPPSLHPCSLKNGGCSDICVSLGNSYTCVCGHGRIFKSGENRTCIPQIDCEFKCDNGACMTLSRVCNGVRDCPDGSDENNCGLHGNTPNHMICSYDEFKCFDGSECLTIDQKCDHHEDCKDKSDEWHCENFNLTTRCHQHQFLCNTTVRCVDLMGLCDAWDDCGDYSDEMVCDLPKSQRPSCGDLHDCGNGQCIDKAWICDGEVDCFNNADESSCHYTKKNCREGFFTCTEDLTCLHMEMVCDGNWDCVGGSDEFNCETSVQPVKKDCDFQCGSNSSICLPQKNVCDGFSDCPRGEDERNCTHCLPSEFECGHANHSLGHLNHCISMEWVCDQEKDCADGSDEDVDMCKDKKKTGLSPNQVQCNKDTFHCNSGECIDMFLVCDDNRDCADGSDEGGKCKTACKKKECDHECIPLPMGAKCSCLKGFMLGPDEQSCLDVNECLENPCDQVCENIYGSFTCSCYPNFMLHRIKTRCKALGSFRSLYYASSSQVRKISAFPDTLEVFWKGQMEIFSMAVDIPRNVLYAATFNEIHQIDMESRAVRTVTGVLSEKMAVDWGSGNVYMSDYSPSAGGRVKVCDFSTKYCVAILSTQKYTFINHLEVDAREQLLFYTKEQVFHGMPSAIYLMSVRLDGTKMVMVARDLTSSVFTLDVNKRVIYLPDIEDGRLLEVPYNGRQSRVVARGLRAMMTPYVVTMAVFQDYVFFAPSGRTFYVGCSIVRNKKANCRTTALDVANMRRFLVVQDTIQPKVDDVCKVHTCKRLCVPAGRTPKCLCHGGVQVAPGEDCPKGEGLVEGLDLLDVDEVKRELAGYSGVEEPSIAGRVVLLVLFILTMIAGIVYMVYRKRYLTSDFTVNNSFTNVSLETSKVKDLPPVIYRPHINTDPDSHLGCEITFDDKASNRGSMSSRTSSRSVIVSSTVSETSGEFTDATHLIN